MKKKLHFYKLLEELYLYKLLEEKFIFLFGKLKVLNNY